MARPLKEYRDIILAQFAGDPVLAPLFTSTSAVALFRLIAGIVGWFGWTIDSLHDTFKIEVDEIIATKKPHSERWYAVKALAFQLGFALDWESDVYDNTGVSEDLVEASKIIKYAAVREQVRGLRIKVAKLVGTDLGPLSNVELDAFTQYMRVIKDAGVKLFISSTVADQLLLGLVIRYDPLVLNSNGARLDGVTATPVKDAIIEFLKNLPFNGVFSVQKLIDAIQNVEGVIDVAITAVQTKYGLLPFTTVNISVIPDSGYLRMEDANLSITYQANE